MSEEMTPEIPATVEHTALPCPVTVGTMELGHATPGLFAALSKAQGEVTNASMNSTNPHFKSKFADLAEILNTVRPAFAAAGLSVIQNTSFDGQMVQVTTVLAHSSGGYIATIASCMPGKTDAQGIGAATTYLRRYSLAAVCGVSQEDDDGESAAVRRKAKAKAEPTVSKADLDAAREAREELGAMLDGLGLSHPEAAVKTMRGIALRAAYGTDSVVKISKLTAEQIRAGFAELANHQNDDDELPPEMGGPPAEADLAAKIEREFDDD